MRATGGVSHAGPGDHDSLSGATKTVTGLEGALVDAASTAFDNAYVVVMLIVAGVLALAAGVTGRLLRGHGPRSAATVSH
jgi:MFS transporter, DHA2 family, multidrug resistance protein